MRAPNPDLVDLVRDVEAVVDRVQSAPRPQFRRFEVRRGDQALYYGVELPSGRTVMECAGVPDLIEIRDAIARVLLVCDAGDLAVHFLD